MEKITRPTPVTVNRIFSFKSLEKINNILPPGINGSDTQHAQNKHDISFSTPTTLFHSDSLTHRAEPKDKNIRSQAQLLKNLSRIDRKITNDEKQRQNRNETKKPTDNTNELRLKLESQVQLARTKMQQMNSTLLQRKKEKQAILERTKPKTKNDPSWSILLSTTVQ